MPFNPKFQVSEMTKMNKIFAIQTKNKMVSIYNKASSEKVNVYQ